MITAVNIQSFFKSDDKTKLMGLAMDIFLKDKNFTVTQQESTTRTRVSTINISLLNLRYVLYATTRAQNTF